MSHRHSVSGDTERAKRNAVGQIVKKREVLGDHKRIYRYEYDDKGRLVRVYRGTGKHKRVVESYTYDANGNRISATVYGTTTTGSYTLDDNLIVYGDNTYRYDEDGYLVEKTAPQGSTSYTYNTLGALTKVVLPNGTTIEYPQDVLNRRVAKKVNGQVVEKYLWEDLTTLLAVYDKDDNLIQRFEYADMRMPVAMRDAQGEKYYLHYDQVGSLCAVSDSNGNIVKEITYDTYGNIVSDSNPSFKVPFGFAGGLYDPDTKLTHFGYREYDAYTGKWTAKDPILFAGGDSNLYGYVLNDPVNLVDPEGLWVVPLMIRIGAMGEVIYNFSEGLKWYVYKTQLHFEIQHLIDEINLNCGCSREERDACDKQILEILQWYIRKTGSDYIGDFSL